MVAVAAGEARVRAGWALSDGRIGHSLPSRGRWRKRLLGAGIAAVSATLVALLGAQAPALAAVYEPGKTRAERSVPGRTHQATPPSDGTARNPLRGDRSVRWPSTAAVEVALAAAPNPMGRVKVGELPLSTGPATNVTTRDERQETVPDAGRIRAQFLDRATADRAGIRGPVWRLARTDGVRTAGTVSVELDYTGFRDAYGADWAHRLRIVRLPECALTTSGRSDCRATAVPTRNDTRAGRLTADVRVSAGGTLFAATAAPAGPTGNYSATSLSPSSTWSGGNPTGDFAWNYPLRVPPGIGGPTPQVAFAYSSSSVDGRTAATNNQPSQIGEGFDFHPGYIERRYKRCADDMAGSNTTTETGDQCWGFDNATISLNGRGGELVLDDTTGVWKIRNDDGSKVERLAGAANGDHEGQHWKVTTSDGTQYFFGLNRLPGWSANKPETQSVLTAPVYGNQNGEKCWKAGNFAGSVCDWAYRWQLDYVIDTHDNVMSYWYQRETNHYAANLKEDQPRGYVRGGWLDRIDYGQRHNEVYTTQPVGRVKFEMAERCVPGSVCDFQHPENYPDTPLDQKCDGGKCEDKFSPTFWSTKRLARVATQVWNGTTHRDVDSWTLRHEYPEPGDGTRPGLWLAGITHTGHVSPPDRTVDPVSLPEVTFDWVQMSNRVSSSVDTSAPMNWFRIKAIHNETGGSIAVVYALPECDRIAGRMPASEDSNTMRCMPVKLPRPGSNTAVDTDWFHKYVVTEVTETDRVTGNPPVVTRYEYLDGGAWRHEDNDGLVDAKYKTWSQWRGYGRVRTIKGGDHDTPIIGETRFFRGMNGDKFGANGTRSVNVTDSAGGSFPDHDEFAGSPREEISYLGAAVLSRTVTDPWRSDPAATRVRSWGTVQARRVDSATVRSHSPLANGGTRSVEVTKSFDAYGSVTQTNDLGDLSTADDDKCVRYSYTRNTDRWILQLASRIETVSVACDKPVNRPADVLSDVLNFYDASTTHGAAPVRGDVTRVDQLAGYSGGQPQYLTVGRTVVDAYGRGIESYNVKGEKTTTTYVPATGGPVTRVTTANPLLHTSHVDLEPAWGSALTSIDANDRRGDLEYDPLGRLVKGWSIDRPRTGGYTPVSEFEYHVSKTGTATVTKGLLPNGGYVTTYELFDGLLRPRQTQVPAAGGGRVLTDTFYDSRGLAYKRNGAYYNESAPGMQVFAVEDKDVPGQNITEYDAAGRATAEAYRGYGVEKWRTRTIFQGDRTHVLPPRGSAATTVVDARGQTVQSIQYRGPALTDIPDTTTYAYTKAGQLASVTDPAGSVWRYHYDLRGRMWKSEDPDKGATELTYNDANEVTSTKDGRSQVLAFAYDRLGRLVRTHEGSLTGPKRTEMVYDTLAKGHPTGSMRFLSGGARYDTRVLGYDLGYRPTGTRVTLPVAEGALSGSYDFTYTYKQNGAPSTVTMPTVGGLPGETLSTIYDDTLGLPVKTLSAQGYYVENTTYTRFSEVEQLRFDMDGPDLNASKVAWRSFHYEDGTRQLTRAVTERQTGPTNRVSDVNYTRDIGGLITKITDTADGGGDTQCFDHDHRNRITQAWTPASDNCDTAPTTGTLGGPAPYWTSWTYDTVGNRKSEVQHRSTGDVSKTYAYPAATDPKPHTVTSVTTTDTTGTRTLDYGYDAAGNTTSRLGPAGGVQTLTWDIEGQLASVVEGGDSTNFVYDASGNRLLRKDAKGTTLFLGAMEVRLDKATNAKTATRYYTHAGQTVAVRTTAGLSWLAQDHHGTGTVTVNEATQSVERRRFTPFGEARGAAPGSWPDSKGFVGGEQDPTGLTHLGARLYDPAIGRFVSADPIADPMDPQQLQGYSYANNSPVSVSDPDGLKPMTDEEWYGPTQAQIAAANTPPSGGGGGGGNSGPPQKEIDEANRVKNKSKLDVVLEAGGEILMEVLGINDIRNCVTKGDIMACAMTVANIIPWGKIFKLPKIIKAFKKAYDAVTSFGEKLKWADNVLKRADEAASASAAAAAKQADEAAAAAAKQADDAAAAGAKQADEAAEAVGESCNSFTPGTLVLMADGSTKPIDQVQVGERVAATDPETGQTEARPVTTTITGNGPKILVDVIVDTDGAAGDATATVTATDGHPFWLPDQGEWLKAAQLKPGDELLTPDGARVSVLAVAVYGAPATVHNLTVGAVHTYYVLAGSTSLLVHNSSGAACNPHEWDNINGDPSDPLDSAPVPPDQLLDGAALRGATGRFAFVVMPDWSMRAVRAGGDMGHANLAEGRNIIMGGMMTIDNGSITHFDNFSGHYWPGSRGPGAGGLEGVARSAFTRNGLNHYIAKWVPHKWKRATP